MCRVPTGEDSDEQRQSEKGPAADQARAALAVPKGPQGQKRPTDVVGRAVHVARIAVGEAEDTTYDQPNKVRAGHAGARARTASLTPDERSAIARKAANARWR